MFRSSRGFVLLCVALVALVALAGCGSSNKDKGGGASTGPAASTDQKVAAEVPAAIKSQGTLRVASDATYAPNEFFASDGKTIQGMDVDLVNGLAKVMGLKADVKNVTFDAIIPGLAAKKYDLGASSFTDTKEREKTVDFVTYFTAGTSFFVKAQGGPAIATNADLCGHKVAAEKGTVQADDATAQGKKCKGRGKPPVQVLVFPDQNGVNLAMSSGRADVGMADSPVAAYAVKKSNGQFKLSGQPYATAPYGLAVPKGNGLAKPLLDALKVLMKNGQYQAILKKWGVEDGAISDPRINGATS
ncbi:MAG: polar amino acid transport system substrate-binding protein [Solirubrobacteraceae bacterium]|nr:polar amino acid transport system substrate-binding protein [Solirubrobacteraceae bacterium]